MNNDSISNKVIVFSDTHFGVKHDPTEDEETNITDLLNMLDLIEDEIRPKTIILLGDIFDLWRVEFEYAWDNADDIQFFKRLSDYVENNKDQDAELIYLIGNHDHFLKEISYAKNCESRYDDIINGINQQPDVGLINEIKNVFKYKHVKIYYPHYKIKFDFGTVYFDHGHFNTKEYKQLNIVFKLIFKYLAKYFSISRLYEKETTNTTPQEIFYDMEGNYSAIFSLLYHSKLDDMVRGARDLIWRTHKKRRYFLSSIIGFMIPSMIYTLLEFGIPSKILEQLNSSNFLPYPIFLVFSLLIGKFGLRVLGAFLPIIVTNVVSSMRGKTVEKVLPEIVEKDISCERENYKYLDLITDIGSKGEEINHYIFAHTHIAGKIVDKNTGLAVYNCGGWVIDEEDKTCTNSFILIDPDIPGTDKIKIFHIDKKGYAECSFDKNGNCDNICKK